MEWQVLLERWNKQPCFALIGLNNNYNESLIPNFTLCLLFICLYSYSKRDTNQACDLSHSACPYCLIVWMKQHLIDNFVFERILFYLAHTFSFFRGPIIFCGTKLKKIHISIIFVIIFGSIFGFFETISCLVSMLCARCFLFLHSQLAFTTTTNASV